MDFDIYIYIQKCFKNKKHIKLGLIKSEACIYMYNNTKFIMVENQGQIN